MTNIVAVDLAAKFSAAIRLSLNGNVMAEMDSWQVSESAFIEHITAPWLMDSNPPIALVVEDLPHGVQYMKITKAVCRLQGRIAERMHQLAHLDRLWFVAPIEWRTWFELKRGTGPDAIAAEAKAQGYQPPDLQGRVKETGDKARARKIATDYNAAFLIGQWARHSYNTHGNFGKAASYGKD